MRNIAASLVELTASEAAATGGGEIFQQPFLIPPPPRPPIFIQPIQPPIAGTDPGVLFTMTW